MAKCAPANLSSAYQSVFYWCPGCGFRHNIRVRADGVPPPSWGWNGSVDKPTFEPSVNYVGRCHHYVRDGRIEFLGDCTHPLAGKTVDLPDVDSEGERIEAP